jgi:hypothetical protein
LSDQWPSEPIPDEDRLYRWAHQQWFDHTTGELSPTFFKNASDPLTRREGMSSDWSRYSTPEESRHRARNPDVNGVIELTVHDVRAIPAQAVEHTPIQNHLDPDVRDNRAHTDVFGPRMIWRSSGCSRGRRASLSRLHRVSQKRRPGQRCRGRCRVDLPSPPPLS